ncbi:UDP-N-acetylmuramoyl-tripeptide--D-alanyl-D-alanine ligase [Campylobacter sp. MIT 99-7217]|uniref:Mur ligase family protein n=1 Tax=Campylobacter sp. MIT 99-7217 TaxID=535091 RepID=UPI001157FB75|nr:UDP-N-acetylmuramoyl-tripeptide--D-alanyl-D-alanine ligase [Campylobacter sp. MIT 99-7217]TQR34629.1 UDP-N-acetylmuramoyl-tripeptide--D-alanyl-D-alanine ligase [Campylobacter sp. MIT 99-7217]
MIVTLTLSFFLQFIYIFLINFCLGFYLITALQWYSYKLNRVFFHFSKPLWHVYFLLLPFLALLFLPSYFYLGFLFLIQAPMLFFWHKRLDKKLVFTTKVKVFFAFLLFFSLVFSACKFIAIPPYFLISIALLLNDDLKFYLLTIFISLFSPLPLIFSLIFLKIYSILANIFYIKKARKKLSNLKDLTIILITASFGKTSIKNFLYELLKEDFKVHKTPRSVNTLLGITADINENLDESTQIYIAEAGARQKGDILEITELLNPQLCIVGEIGEAHLEYFKSKEAIRQTKLEALQTNRLKKAFLHSSTKMNETEQILIYDKALKSVHSSLEGLSFKLQIHEQEFEFKANLLGSFNAQNLCACILVANFLGISLEKLQNYTQKIKPVEHRLQIISKEPKLIIDDGFNGNFNGMSESYKLCKTYKGRRVLVSPGIIEVNEEQNIKLCELINECFDLAIITASVNLAVFKKYLHIEKIIVENKETLVDILAQHTKNGDLILFSNDAPTFM